MSAHLQYRLSKQRQFREKLSVRTPSDDHPAVIAPAPMLYGGAFLVGALFMDCFPGLFFLSTLLRGQPSACWRSV